MHELNNIYLEPVSDYRAILGEGPCWLEEKKALMWVDIEGKQLRFYYPGHAHDQGHEEVYELPERAGAAVGYTDRKVVLALESGFAYYDLDTRETTPIHDPENREDNRFNDGKCDAAGRFWAGTMSLVGKDKQGSFYCLDTDLSVRTIFGDVSTSNGLGWSPDGTVMYYIDTGTKKVQAFEFDVETGTRCPDVVVHKAWFLIDIHNPAGGGQAEGHSQPAIPYDIPYGALVPRGVDGMLTAGRCISGTHRAHASYRVMAICLATGQAAGTAAALCAKRGELPRELDYHLVQDALQKAGCTLFDQK